MKQIRKSNIAGNQGKSACRQTAYARCLRKAFGITGPFSNIAISVSFFLFLAFLAFLAIWKAAGINWTRYAGAGCFLASLVTCAIAFMVDTVSRIVCMAECIRARMKGEKPRIFKDEKPEFAKIIAKCFRFVKSSKDTRKLCVSACSARSIPVNSHMHNHARTYRRAARPAFAHASNSPGGDGSDDGSGDSDSDDPPGQQNPVILPDSSRQPNKQDHPWRPPGRFRMPRRSQRRRFA